MHEDQASDGTSRLLHETLLGDAWQNAGDAVVVFDDERNFIAFNDAYCRLTGYSRQEIVALRIGGSLVVDDESQEVFAHRLQNPGGGFGQAALRRKDGLLVEVAYRLIETTVARMPYFIAIVWPVAGES